MVRIGVDIGGTKIALGIVDDSNTIVSDTIRFPVKPLQTGDALVEKLVDEAMSLYKKNGYSPEDIAGIGVGSPGPLELQTGTILNPQNIPMLHNYELRKSIKQTSGLPVELNNDANCFVLGEALAGQARKGDIIIGITLGTGYGCGIVLNKKLYTGATGTAAEIAVTPYRDSDMESYISGRGLSRAYRQRSGEDLNGKAIAALAYEGNEQALGAFREFGEHVGRSLAIFTNLLDPDYIVVGGSIANNWDLFIESLKDTMYQSINPRPKEHLQVVRSELGESAAIIGAAGLITG